MRAKGLDDLIQAGGRPRLRPLYPAPPGIGERRAALPAAQTGKVAQGLPLDGARRVTARAIDRFVDRRHVRPPRAQLVRSSPCTGKTRGLAKAIQANRVRARVVVGTQSLAAELPERYGYVLIEGRRAGNCARFDVVEALSCAGHPVGPNACGTVEEPRCPHRESCRYFAQFGTAGTRIGATEQIYNANFLRGGELVAIDDGDLGRATIRRVRLDGPALADALERLKRRGRPALVRLVQVVTDAVLEPPTVVPGRVDGRLLGASVWDHLAEAAARHGEDLVELIQALPETPTLPALPDDKVLTVDAVDFAPPALLLQLVSILRDKLSAFQSGEPFNSYLRLRDRGLDLTTPRRHVADRHGEPLLAGLPVLVLDATPTEALLTHLLRHHQRLPDVEATARIPESVRVVQHATAPNGHAAMREQRAVARVIDQNKAERGAWPVDGGAEGVVAFKALRTSLEQAGFVPEHIVTFGSARGSNALATV